METSNFSPSSFREVLQMLVAIMDASNKDVLLIFGTLLLISGVRFGRGGVSDNGKVTRSRTSRMPSKLQR